VVFRRFRLNLLLPLLFLPRAGLRAAIGIHALAESYEFIEVEMPIPIRVEVGKKLLDLQNENCRRHRQDSSAARIECQRSYVFVGTSAETSTPSTHLRYRNKVRKSALHNHAQLRELDGSAVIRVIAIEQGAQIGTAANVRCGHLGK
jgi:hypothetical protein